MDISSLFFVFICFAAGLSFAYQIPSAEISALSDLFVSTNGLAWVWKNSTEYGIAWNFTDGFSNDPCGNNWQGIICTSEPDNNGNIHIQSISLVDYNLAGSIPNSINSFSELGNLELTANYLKSSIPDSIGNLTELYNLDISVNNLEHSIPSSLCNLANLKSLSLRNNKLNSNIPKNIGALTQLTELHLDYNLLTWTIPNSLCDCVALIHISLDNNMLRGSLPANLGNLKNLSTFSAATNALLGSLPISLMRLTTLTSLILSENAFSHSLPSDMGNWAESLVTLYLDHNEFNGSLPQSLYKLNSLFDLFLNDNHLSGTVSDDIGNLRNLYDIRLGNNLFIGLMPDLSRLNFGFFDLSNNYITGTLSDCFSTAFQSLDVSYNFMAGTIPSSFCALDKALYFNLGYNQFTGTVPPCLGSWTHLMVLELNHNSFSGPMPAVDGEALLYLFMDHNLFTGSVPSLCNQKLVTLFYLNSNLLDGTLPSCLSQWIQVVDFEVDNNILSGPVPSVATYQNLETFFVNNNHLSGSLQGVFDNTTMIALLTVDLSSNQFTGALPAEPFKCRRFQSFAAVSNCFDAAIPVQEICESPLLSMLAIDGMMSASSCQNRFFASYTGVNSYWLSQSLNEPIPSCLFSKSLAILHLSGNGFTGTIPNVRSSHVLQDVSLSHNRLSGTVPRELSFLSLDLSFNKLSGVLDPDAQKILESGSLSLQVNRLSGDVPAALQSTAHINILDGNLFGCSPDRSDLPVHDSSVNDYECGSTTLNYVIYVWVALAVDVLLIGVAVAYATGKWIEWKDTTAEWMAVYSFNGSSSSSGSSNNSGIGDSSSSDLSQTAPQGEAESQQVFLPHLVQFGAFLREFRTVTLALCAVVFCVTIVVNALLSVYFNSYAYEYAWNIASVYLSGTTPAVVLLFMLVVLTGVALCIINKFTSWLQNSAENHADNSSKSAMHWTAAQKVALALTVVANVAIIVGVNSAYVYISQNYSYDAVQAAQLAVAVFKVVWNNVAVRGVLNRMQRYNRRNQTVKRFKDNDALESSSTEQLLLRESQESVYSVEVAVFITLFNNLAAPFIAIALVSSNCFYNVITTPPAVNVWYTYAKCINYEVVDDRLVCTSYLFGADVRQTSYIPPFTYSYQCSSAFITTYAPVYILMFILITFLSPAVQCALHLLLSHTPKGSYVNSLVAKLLPNIVKPISLNRTTNTAPRGSNTWGDIVVASALDLVFSRRLFDCDVFVVQLVSLCAVISTFGVVFPPLALIGCVAVFGTTYNAQLLIGRYIVKVRQLTDLQQHESADVACSSCVTAKASVLTTGIEADVANAKQMFVSSVWIAVPFVVVFYSFLLFDTLGDEVGWEDAVWMPVAVVVAVCLVWAGSHLLRYHYTTPGWCGWNKSTAQNQLSRNSYSVLDSGETEGNEDYVDGGVQSNANSSDNGSSSELEARLLGKQQQ